MEYVGFIMLMVGVAGMDGNAIVAGIIATIGVAIIAIKARKECGHR